MRFDLRTRHNPGAAFHMMLGGESASEHEIQMLPIDELMPYPEQPFKPYTEDKLQELAEDIRLNGILCPLIVRERDEEYEILAGRNRCNAASLAGLERVPCILRDVDDATAALIMGTTNLNQREKLLPSEKAKAYAIQLNAMKRRPGRKREKNAAQIGPQKRSSEILAESVGESRNSVKRYVRLTHLTDTLLSMVDNKELPLNVGVELSYLSQEQQERLHIYIQSNRLKINLKQAGEIRSAMDTSTAFLDGVFGVKKQTASSWKPGKATRSVLERQLRYRNLDDGAVAEILEEALRLYFAQRSD